MISKNVKLPSTHKQLEYTEIKSSPNVHQNQQEEENIEPRPQLELEQVLGEADLRVHWDRSPQPQ